MPFMKTVAFTVLLVAARLVAADTIPSSEAKNHVGETATVCGHVADSRYQESGSHVTFLNFDKTYPNHTFTGFIPGDSRARFTAPEKEYLDKDVCVTGKIQDYRGKPEIVLTDPQQIRLQAK